MDSLLLKVHRLDIQYISQLSEILRKWKRSEGEIIYSQKLLRCRLNGLMEQVDDTLKNCIYHNFSAENTIIQVIQGLSNTEDSSCDVNDSSHRVLLLLKNRQTVLDRNEASDGLIKWVNKVFQQSLARLSLSKEGSGIRLELVYRISSLSPQPDIGERLLTTMDIAGIKRLLRQSSTSETFEEAFSSSKDFIENINPLQEHKFEIFEEPLAKTQECVIDQKVLDYVFYATMIHCLFNPSDLSGPLPPQLETLLSFIFIHFKELEPAKIEELALKLNEVGLWKRKVKNEFMMNESLYSATEGYIQSEWNKYSSHFQYTYRKFIYRQ